MGQVLPLGGWLWVLHRLGKIWVALLQGPKEQYISEGSLVSYLRNQPWLVEAYRKFNEVDGER